MSGEKDLGQGGETPVDAVAGEAASGAADGPKTETGPGVVPARDGRPEEGAVDRPQAFLFDVFGTLVDWRAGVALAVGDAFAAKGIETDPHAFADAWRRAYHPAMEPIRSGERGYVQLDDLHRENLSTTLEAHGLGQAFDDLETADLARAWERLPPWPDVHRGLARIKALAPVCACSNGSVALMVHLARFADLPWDAVLGAEIARDYKPKAEVYLASCAAMRIAPEQAVMVACHPADLDAAAAAGLRCAYVPRPMEWGEAHVHDVMDLGPAEARWDVAAPDLEALAARFGG